MAIRRTWRAVSMGANARTLITVATLSGVVAATIVGAIDQAPVAQGIPTPSADFVTASINRARCYATNEHVPVRPSESTGSSLTVTRLSAH